MNATTIAELRNEITPVITLADYIKNLPGVEMPPEGWEAIDDALSAEPRVRELLAALGDPYGE